MSEPISQSEFARKFHLMVAPNGARLGKEDHPTVPLSPDELADTARDCWEAGADSIHMHVCDRAGLHSLDVGHYREAIAAVSEAAPLMQIQITTECASRYDVGEEFACLTSLQPNAASVSVREVLREPKVAERLYAFTREAGIRIQHILYSSACLQSFLSWRAAGHCRRSTGGGGIIAIRARGVYFALITFGMAQVVAKVIYNTRELGASDGIIGIPIVSIPLGVTDIPADAPVGFFL